VARPELGTKRVCPTTGRKFYDLGRDPIVSPYTGVVLARAAFEPTAAPRRGPEPEDDSEDEADVVAAGPETVSLEDAAAEQEGAAETGDEAELADDDTVAADDTFLEEEEENGDVSDLVDSDLEDDEEG
jgi:uncharacterized protein (TIGR02300 family)